jgi:hypothetical protein
VASKWITRRALRLHVAIAIALPSFSFMFQWQLRRALGGNGLSWAYTVEWPLFGAYALFMWWKLLHEEIGGAPPPTHTPEAPDHDEDAVRLAAYNDYLARLAASDTEDPATRD